MNFPRLPRTTRRACTLSALLSAAWFLATLTVSAQKFPFPQHVAYAPGSIKPAVAQGAMDQAAKNFYDAWKARYLVPGCQSNHAYVYYSLEYKPADQPNAITVSEAHGYGMMILALMAGHDPNARPLFDGMYRYFTNHQSGITPYLMAWQQVTGCVTPSGGDDSATDGDLDIAYALLLADRQWGSGDGINYLGEARKVIAALMKGSVNTNAWSLRLGDWTASTDDGTRPSDFMPDHFRAFQAFGTNTNWSRVTDRCYAIIERLQTNYSKTTGLLPDFVIKANAAAQPAGPNYLESANDGHYSYNACRTPWRIGTDYLVSGDPRPLAAMNRLNAWIRTKTANNPANIKAGYNLTNGVALENYSELAFTAPFLVGAMVNVSNQTWLNTLWTNVTSTPITSDAYYGNSIKMLCLLVGSGNWWTPALKSPAIKNQSYLPSGHFAFDLDCEPQFINRVQGTTDFLSWATLLTTNPPASVSNISFADSQASLFDRRFYRVGSP